jgi:hypothetical protein
MIQLRSGRPVAGAAALTMVIAAGCVRPAGIAPALAACPAPRQQTDDWRAVAESAGVSFRIPPAFVEQPRDEGAHRFYLRGDFSEYLLAGFIESSAPAEAMGRVPSPGMMEMSQCVDSIGGRQVLVQAWRTRDGTFRDGQRMDRYDVFAVVPVTPELRLYIASGSHRRETQHLALVAVRTIVVAPAPPDTTR